jgi:hypothetical protein
MISERLARGAGACLVLLPFSASVLAQEEIALWQVHTTGIDCADLF